MKAIYLYDFYQYCCYCYESSLIDKYFESMQGSKDTILHVL